VPYTFFTHDTAGAATIDYWGKPGGNYSAIEKNNSSATGTSDGGQGVFPPGTVWYYPGLDGNFDNYGVVRFTVPGGGGSYRLVTAVHSYLDGASSGDTDFHVLKNGTPLFEQFLPGSSGTSYSNLVTLSGGDTIDFIVGRGADGHLSGSGLKIAASLTLTTNLPPPPPPPASSYDLARDFSTSNNPSGPWTFGYETNIGSALVPYTFFTHDTAGPATVDVWAKPGGFYSAIEKNNSSVTGTSDGGQGVYLPGSVWYYPGLEGNLDNYSVVRFTTPASGSGTYRLLSSVHSYLDGPSSGDTDFHILKNGTPLFEQFLAGSSGTSYSNLVALIAGDTVDFIVGRGADGHLFGSGLKIAAGLTLTTNSPTPPTFAEATSLILSQVDASNIDATLKAQLEDVLNRAIDSFRASRTISAMRQLRLFQRRLDPLQQDNPSLAQAWSNAAQQIIDAAAATLHLGPDHWPAELSAATRDASGAFQFTFSGDEGASYVVEASEDLLNWTTLTTVVNCSLEFLPINDANAAGSNQKFYRAKPTP